MSKIILPPSDLMPRIARHLDELAETLGDVENALGDILPRTLEDRAILRLQTLDQIRQSVEDLSVLMTLIGQASLSKKVCLNELSDKDTQLTLQSTKNLLKTAPNFTQTAQDVGNLDLF